MSTLTVTSKGQVTLRKEVLKHLGVQPGEKVSVDLLPNGRVEVRAAPKGDISDIFGLLDNPHDIHLTIEEIDDFTHRAWAGER
jgi:AbrB family looped-hinge helix DNA binding protein